MLVSSANRKRHIWLIYLANHLYKVRIIGVPGQSFVEHHIQHKPNQTQVLDALVLDSFDELTRNTQKRLQKQTDLGETPDI